MSQIPDASAVTPFQRALVAGIRDRGRVTDFPATAAVAAQALAEVFFDPRCKADMVAWLRAGGCTGQLGGLQTVDTAGGRLLLSVDDGGLAVGVDGLADAQTLAVTKAELDARLVTRNEVLRRLGAANEPAPVLLGLAVALLPHDDTAFSDALGAALTKVPAFKRLGFAGLDQVTGNALALAFEVEGMGRAESGTGAAPSHAYARAIHDGAQRRRALVLAVARDLVDVLTAPDVADALAGGAHRLAEDPPERHGRVAVATAHGMLRLRLAADGVVVDASELARTSGNAFARAASDAPGQIDAALALARDTPATERLRARTQTLNEVLGANWWSGAATQISQAIRTSALARVLPAPTAIERGNLCILSRLPDDVRKALGPL